MNECKKERKKNEIKTKTLKNRKKLKIILKMQKERKQNHKIL